MSKFPRPLRNPLPKTSSGSRLLPIAAVILASTVCLSLAARVFPQPDAAISWTNWFVTLIPESWNNTVSTNVASGDHGTPGPALQTASTKSAAVIPERTVVSFDASAPRSITKPDAVSTSSGFSLPGIVSTGPSVAALAQPVNAATGSANPTNLIIARTKTSSPQAVDPTWIGPSFSSWNDASHWSPATVPNGVGVIATFQPSSANVNPMLTNQDVPGGATLGTLSLAGTGAQSWNVGLSTSLTMNNNGNGAVISNVNTAAGNYMLQISAGASASLVLADNLSITNSSGSTQFDSILINAPITGTGNITFNNVSNTITMGQIFLQPNSPSTFVGTSTIASGAVVFSDDSAFGSLGNQIILGSAGGGDATLASTGSAFNFAHPVLVAAGSGGTLSLGTISPSTTNHTVFLAPIVLNGDVALDNPFPNAASTIFANTISGVGGITKHGAGPIILISSNTFTGATNVNFGQVILSAQKALGATSSITVRSGGTLVFDGPYTDRINDTAQLFLDGNDSPGATLETSGSSEHGATNNTAGIGAVTLMSNSNIDLASGSSVIAFANSSAQTWTGILTIYNWSGNLITGNGTDQVYFGNGVTGLTPAQLNSIRFYSDAGSNFLGTANWGLDLDGEIVPTLVPVPVPEPATWIGGALALGAIAARSRRRRIRNAEWSRREPSDTDLVRSTAFNPSALRTPHSAFRTPHSPIPRSPSPSYV